MQSFQAVRQEVDFTFGFESKYRKRKARLTLRSDKNRLREFYNSSPHNNLLANPSFVKNVLANSKISQWDKSRKLATSTRFSRQNNTSGAHALFAPSLNIKSSTHFYL